MPTKPKATWTQRAEYLDFLHRYQQMYAPGTQDYALTPKTGKGTGRKATWEKMHGQFVKMRRQNRATWGV